MSFKLKLFFVFVCLLLVPTVFFYQKQSSNIDCKILWGPAKIISNKKCEFSSELSANASLVNVFKIPSGSFANSNLIMTFDGNGFANLAGLEVRLFSKKIAVGKYVLPVFADSSLNLLQDNIATSLSINSTSVQNKSNDFLSTEIDQIQIYFSATDQKQLNLSISSLVWIDKPKTGRVSLTFDDAYTDHYFAGEVLYKYGLSATAYIIPDAINQPNYLTREQLEKLKKWNWQLGSHLVQPATDLDSSEYEAQLKTAIEKLKKFGSSDDETHFAFPLGKYNNKVLEVSAKYLKSARLASGGVESLPPQETFRLRTINVTPAMTPDKLLALAQEAIAHGDWLILMFHYIDKPEKGDLNYSLKDFETLAKGLSQMHNNVKTVREVLTENNL